MTAPAVNGAGSGRSAAALGRGRRRVVGLALMLAVLAAAGWGVRSGWWAGPLDAAERALAAGRVREAGATLQRAVRDAPRDPRAQLLYARFLRLSGLPREADAALGRAQDLGAPEAGLWREYGLLVAEPDFRRADPILRRALDRAPEDVEVLRALAGGLSRQGRWPEAADLYGRWLRVEPGRAEALLGRSRALVQAGRSAEAAVELRALLARRPDDYEARLLLANGLLSDADLARAEPELERCRQLRPDRPEPLAGLAGCALGRDDPGRARELLDRAVALDPASVLALAARANLALNLREYDRARADFDRVAALDPGNKQAHLHLAQLCHRAGDRTAAAEHEQAYRRLQAEQEERFRAVRGMR